MVETTISGDSQAVMADGFLDKLLTVITKSDKIGFGLFFAGSVVFVWNRLKVEPFSYLSNEQVVYIIFAALFGGALVLLRILSWAGEKYLSLSTSFRAWRRKRRAVDRLNELLPIENSGLIWILVNDQRHVHGNRLQDPLEGLVRKGFLFPTDDREIVQVLRVNPAVFKHSERILRDCPPDVQAVYRGRRSPWDNTRERF
jgi:hypothetical protein